MVMQDIHATVLSIYDAVADEALWPGVLQRCADEIDALGCIIFEWHDSDHGRALSAPLASSYYDPAAISRYVSRCFADEASDQDVFEAHSLARDSVDLIEDDVLAASATQLDARANVQVLRKLGIKHRAAGLLNKDNTAVARFSIQLADGRGRLSDRERAHLGALLPHIAKALDLGRPAQQLAAVHQSMLSAMDRLSIGVCVIDPGGRIVARNAEFRRQDEAHRMFDIGPGGIFRLREARHEKRFQTLKEHALNHGRFGARPRKEAIMADDSTFLCLEVTPLHRSQEMGARAFDGFLLYSTDTSRPVRCDTRPMQSAYGLTNAERALIDLISEGLTNNQIA
ncbi:MAG: LuxR family transcriptional regulator [Pseudomonadota bacterium]